MRRPDPRWTRGVDLFNRGEFFDAHEAVEELWLEAAGGEREFLKGFIQCAVALEHHRRGNPRGFRSVGATAVRHLAGADPRSGGLDVEGLLRDFRDFADRVGRGESPGYPGARWLEEPPPGGAEGATVSAETKAAPDGTAAPAVVLTPLAAERLKAMVREQEIPAEEQNLRVALRVGGCSGFSYEMGFDRAGPADLVSEVEGVRVVVAPGDLPHLRGMIIDFVDTVQEQGFKITNPNARSSCGCGQSFEA